MIAFPAVLDGGMGRQLERCGAPFRQPEWSALALMEAPDTVVAAHRAFLKAGAGLITTNSYALVPFHIGDDRFWRDGARLAALSGRLARQAAEGTSVLVAGSLPPLFGSYQPDLFDGTRAPAMLAELVPSLAPHVDLFLAETMSCIAEALAALEAVRPTGKPAWVSFTLAPDSPSRLRSGEAVEPAVRAVREAGAEAVLFNCSPPEVIGDAVATARAVLGPDVPIGAYANAFPEEDSGAANEGISPLRPELTPDRYRDWAATWRRLGATGVGGCCGIGPEHIEKLGATA